MIHIRHYRNHYLENKRGDKVREKIIEIINNWNPAEIYPLLSDEYHSESQRVIKASQKTDSVEKLAKEIFDIFQSNFGKEFTKSMEECKIIAEKIKNVK